MPFSTLYKETDTSPNSVRVDADFDAAFDSIYVPSHANKELVYNYKPERTLIQADLIFNMPATEQTSRLPPGAASGFLTRLFSALTHTRGHAMGQKRFIWYATSSADRQGFSRARTHIEGGDFDRFIPCHGDVIETGGKDIFRKIMGWHLDLARKAE